MISRDTQDHDNEEDEATWTCPRCMRAQEAGTLMTFPAYVLDGNVLRLQPNAPACCPHCAEGLPRGPGRGVVFMRYIGVELTE